MPQWMRRFGREQGQRFVAWNQTKPFSHFGARSFRQHFGEDAGSGDGGSGGGGDGGGAGGGGGTGGGAGGGDGGAGGGAGGGSPKTFTQDDVNSIVKKEREAYQAKQRETLKQLEDLRGEKNTSDEQAKKLDTQIATMRTELMSEKEKAEAEKNRIAEEHKRALDAASGDRDAWQTRYESSQVLGDLLAAASKHKAYNSQQVVAVLQQGASLVEVKDAEGKPTGEFKVEVKAKVKEGEAFVEKVVTADEAVAGLKAQKEFANLFLAERQGGTGYRPGTGSGDDGGGDDMSPTEKIKAGLAKGQASARDT